MSTLDFGHLTKIQTGTLAIMGLWLGLLAAKLVREFNRDGKDD